MPTLSRRQFLGSTLAAAMGGCFIPHNLFAYSSNRNTRIVIVTDDNATNGSTVNADVVAQMVNAGIKQLTQRPTVGEAWMSLFPGVTTGSKISLKENLSWSPAGSVIVHPATTDAIIDGLQAMPVAGGAPPLENTLIWDLDKDPIIAAGYTINWGGPGVQCYYAVEDWWVFVNGGGVGDGLGFDPAYTCTIHHPPPYPETNHHPTTIITQHTDYLINVGILGYHAEATITGVLKNHYGSYDAVRYPLYPNGYAMHGDGLSLGIPSFNAFIRDSLGDKQRVFVTDALIGACLQGPQAPPDCVPKAMIFGTDPVAVDYQMTVLLNAERAEQSQGPVDPPHVAAAAGAPYNLGTNDPSEMDVVEINNPSIPPNPVENVVVNRIGDDIHLSWDEVPGVSNYNVYQLDSAYSSEPGTRIGATIETSFTHVGAAFQESGYYRVTAEY
jgi:hypothetical protein